MDRKEYIHQIENAFKVTPIVAILGPRQCGKTTLAKQYVARVKESSRLENYFDLEDPDDLTRLTHPKLTLSALEGLITLDEIQRVPEIFPLLRVMVDDNTLNQKYLILGSASRMLIRQSSETLAGRISYIELTPFNLSEVNESKNLWLRGGFPRSYLAQDDQSSVAWRKEFIRTYLEQDIPQLGIQVITSNLRRFWMTLAHYHGNIFNASEIGRALNISHTTTKSYLDILSNTFMLRQLQPWHENIKKRQVKSPKIYFRDSGILHALMGIKDTSDLLTHPKIGASWEGFALEEITRHLNANQEDCYFWAAHAHAELDLLVFKDGKKYGYEFKYSDTPRLSKSMYTVLEDLKLEKLIVIYPGNKQYSPHEKVIICGLEDYISGACGDMP